MLNERQVVALAIKYGADRRAPRDSWQYAEGMLGLLRAAQKWEPERGFQFSTYAHNWIKSFILRQIQRLNEPKHAGKKQTLAFSQFGDDEASTFEQSLGQEDDPSQPAIRAEYRSQLLSVMGILDPRTRQFILRHLLHEETLLDIGSSQSPPITRQRVRQIVDRGVEKLRRRFPQFIARAPRISAS